LKGPEDSAAHLGGRTEDVAQRGADVLKDTPELLGDVSRGVYRVFQAAGRQRTIQALADVVSGACGAARQPLERGGCTSGKGDDRLKEGTRDGGQIPHSPVSATQGGSQGAVVGQCAGGG